jgi:dTDP-4-dehydrorhamnose 3,5-epimerase-like enzyme
MKESPKLIIGVNHADNRGKLLYNNDFDASKIKRVYMIENATNDIIRGWQGHQIEQRWFEAVNGIFQIQLISIDDWNNPSKDLKKFIYVLDASKLDMLHVLGGYVSSIQSLELNSKLLVMADYSLGEIKDEYKFNLDYFA